MLMGGDLTNVPVNATPNIKGGFKFPTMEVEPLTKDGPGNIPTSVDKFMLHTGRDPQVCISDTSSIDDDGDIKDARPVPKDGAGN